MPKLPKRYENFVKEFPEIASAYENLGKTVHKHGPLDDKNRALIKLGISAGLKSEGAVHAHTRKALEAGVEKDAIRQVALLCIPTIGFPSAMAVLSWMDDVLNEK